jgi:hypothetical protein
MLELIALLQLLQFAGFHDFIREMTPAYGLRRDRLIGSEVRIR